MKRVLLIVFVFLTCCKDEAPETPQLIVKPGAGVSDVESNSYPSVIIGDQEWLGENLRTTKFNDGTNIPFVTDQTAWFSLSSPAYTWYNNDISNKEA